MNVPCPSAIYMPLVSVLDRTICSRCNHLRDLPRDDDAQSHQKSQKRKAFARSLDSLADRSSVVAVNVVVVETWTTSFSHQSVLPCVSLSRSHSSFDSDKRSSPLLDLYSVKHCVRFNLHLLLLSSLTRKSIMWANPSNTRNLLQSSRTLVARRSIVNLGNNNSNNIRTVIYPSVSRFSTASVEVEHGRGQWKTYGDVSSYKQGKYQIKCFNKISPIGLTRFPTDQYDVRPDGKEAANAHAILLRSHKLQEQDVPKTVRAIARCGAGTNNIPVPRMTELGIPVFNTPGANANAVKELVLCGMLLGSRRIIDGINHMKRLGEQGLAKEKVEKDKAMFGGQEIRGKTLSVIGLGTYILLLFICPRVHGNTSQRPSIFRRMKGNEDGSRTFSLKEIS